MSIDSRLVEIAAIILDISLINPTNVSEQRERFFKNNDNLIFTYKPFSAQPIIDELESMQIPNDNLGIILNRARSFLLLYAKALSNRGSDEFAPTDLYGKPSTKLIEKAKELLQNQEDSTTLTKFIPGREAAFAFEDVLEEAGIEGWNVKEDANAQSAVSVNAGAKEVTIRKDALFSREHIEKLLVHEIETHIFRAENGMRQPLKILGTESIPGALKVEEGLAGYNEELAGVAFDSTLATKALRVLAVDMALRGSFQDVFNVMREYVDESPAFNLAVRAKRGMGNTSKPGGFPKDHTYLEGYLAIKDYVERGNDLEELYVGKISFKELALFDKLKDPKWIPDFYPE